MDISIVVPLLNEVDSLNELTDLVVEQLKKLDKQFEIIFIDDGSNDGSFEVLKRLKENCKEIKVIRFRKNFGKSAALSEGFKRANGEIVITMDADLQDDPTEIPNLVTQLNNGFDLVSGWKKKQNSTLKTI